MNICGDFVGGGLSLPIGGTLSGLVSLSKELVIELMDVSTEDEVSVDWTIFFVLTIYG